MTHHTMVTPAVTLVAQPPHKYNAINSNILTMNQANKQQQKSYVSSLVGKSAVYLINMFPYFIIRCDYPGYNLYLAQLFHQ